MPDFTIRSWMRLLEALQKRGYAFQTFSDFLEKPAKRSVILRHDVDRLPGNALRFARTEHELGIKGTYYFRIVPESNHPGIIREIASLGHEIGYHYEDLSLIYSRQRKTKNLFLHRFSFRDGKLYGTRKDKSDDPSIFEQAIRSFSANLEYFRRFYPVTSVCMHGNPLSPLDNRALWEHYDYREYGIRGEPYFDLDFSRVLYLTDTGRKWNGEQVSVRDVPYTRKEDETGKQPLAGNFSFRTTPGITRAALHNKLPDHIMFTFHPQRWTDRLLPWMKELIGQRTKNAAKFFLAKKRRITADTLPPGKKT